MGKLHLLLLHYCVFSIRLYSHKHLVRVLAYSKMHAR